MNQSEKMMSCQSDIQLAEKAAQFLKLIESQIALGSFKGARKILSCNYALALLGEDTVKFMINRVDDAQKNYKKDGKRLHWEWHVIFVFTTLSIGYLIWKFGMLDTFISLFVQAFTLAKLIIGKAVFHLTTLISTSFVKICSIVKSLINKVY